MNASLEYRRDPSEWLDAVEALDRLALRIPDGAARLTAFHSSLRLTGTPDAFITRKTVVQNGVLVVRMMPGPETVAFLSELESLL